MIAALALGAPPLLGAQGRPPEFRFRAGRSGAGTVLHYVKSNIDGTHASSIALYRAAPDRLESFKYSPGEERATLVVAYLDTVRLTVRRFESLRVYRDGRRDTVATLEAIPGTTAIRLSFGGQSRTDTLANWPWHSYDFDFASLGALFPHLVDMQRSFTIGIADVGPAPGGGPMMTDFGPVQVEWQGTEVRSGRRSHRYRIDGPGLRRRGGVLWVDERTGTLVDYEIALPDEEGFTSGKLRLEREEPMSPAAWLDFIRARLAAGP